MTAPRLEPVTSWAELRTMLRVVVKRCRYCAKDHEVTLVRLEERTGRAAAGRVDWMLGWVGTPAPECVLALRARHGKHIDLIVAPLAVEQGRVFRVVDPAAETDVAVAKARPREIV